MSASSSYSFQLPVKILYSSQLMPVFTTDLQCPRSSAADSHVAVSFPATFMSRLHVGLGPIFVADSQTCVLDSDELTMYKIINVNFRDATVSHSMYMAEPSQTPLISRIGIEGWKLLISYFALCKLSRLRWAVTKNTFLEDT